MNRISLRIQLRHQFSDHVYDELNTVLDNDLWGALGVRSFVELRKLVELQNQLSDQLTSLTNDTTI